MQLFCQGIIIRDHKTLFVTRFGNGSGDLSSVSQAFFLSSLTSHNHKHHFISYFYSENEIELVTEAVETFFHI